MTKKTKIFRQEEEKQHLITEFKRLKGENKSLKQIGKILKVNPTSIYHWMKPKTIVIDNIGKALDFNTSQKIKITNQILESLKTLNDCLRFEIERNKRLILESNEILKK